MLFDGRFNITKAAIKLLITVSKCRFRINSKEARNIHGHEKHVTDFIGYFSVGLKKLAASLANLAVI